MREYLPRRENVFSVNNSTKDHSDAGIDTAILSVGATEQCGPRLPLNIDTLVAEYYARAWGQVLGAYVLPPSPSTPQRSTLRSRAPSRSVPPR